MVNSDQTWFNYDKNYFYDNAFLKFAENFTIPKFIYAASSGRDEWIFSETDEEEAKRLLKNFTGISFREKGMVKLVEEHLNITASFVLDPTLLLEKDIYLNEINDYKNVFNISEKYIFVYQLDKNEVIEEFIKNSKIKL